MTNYSTHLPEADVSVNQLDAYLHQLIAILQTLEPGTLEWRRAMDRFLRMIQAQPEFRKYLRSDCPDFLLDALNQTFQWLSRGGIKQFNLPQDPLETREKLVKWLQCPKSYLWWRVKESPSKAETERIRQLIPGWRASQKNKGLKPEKKQILSLDTPIGNDDEVGTWLDKLDEDGRIINDNDGDNFPTFSRLERLVETNQIEKRQQFGFELKKYIEEDPKNELLNCRLQDQPDGINVSQILILRMSFKDPPDTLTVIARDLGINYHTLRSHWKSKKLTQLLQEITEKLATEIGYQLNPEEEL